MDAYEREESKMAEANAKNAGKTNFALVMIDDENPTPVLSMRLVDEVSEDTVRKFIEDWIVASGYFRIDEYALDEWVKGVLLDGEKRWHGERWCVQVWKM